MEEVMNNTQAIPEKIFHVKMIYPLVASILALLMNYYIPNHPESNSIERPYFTYLLIGLTIIFIVIPFIGRFNDQVRSKYLFKTYFTAFIITVLNIVNVVTAKTDFLPFVYFPTIDKVLGVFIKDGAFLIKCVFYSMSLFLTGTILGGIAGFITGIGIGWSKSINYWVYPIVRSIGPIPATIWIPFALLASPTSYGASAFIIGLSMWFQTTILTSSGIQNIPREYFEAARTLGADSKYQIRHVAIPAALPSVFIGIFNGVVACFVALIVAEMIGVKYGIGWYINWQQQTMSFANVYAALIIIGVMCAVTLKLIFKLRDRFLSWQEGIIRW